MKGFPKILGTGADLLNCLAMVQAGALDKDDLTQAIAAIEEREYITIPIFDTSNGRKTVVVMDCGELAAGVGVKNTVEGTTIVTVERQEQDPEAAPDNTPSYATVTLSKALSADMSVLKITAPADPYESLGVDRSEVNAIKEVLKQL
jgi:hypothetical protein